MAAQAASGPKEQPLTEGVLLAASPIGRGRGETPESMLRRVSHLNLQQKKLKTLVSAARRIGRHARNSTQSSGDEGVTLCFPVYAGWSWAVP